MELVRFPSRGGFSVRSIFSFALAVIITALLWVIFSGAPAHAADATWQNGVILYDNNSYTKDDSFKDSTGTVPSGATVYKTATLTENGPVMSQKVLVLFFAPGVDPPTSKSASHVEFTYKNGTLSDPINQQTVNVTLPDESGNSGSSCSVSGIGWIICPTSEFLAGAMDWAFDTLSLMIEVQPPILGDPNNSMYIAWNTMRTIANVAFVIVFLIIIFSQLTSWGVSSYGLKRLTPRLIIAAILVNISFYITALAIDISNIAGFSIQNIFNGIRENMFYMSNATAGDVTILNEPWTAVTAVILGGGGLALFGLTYAASGGLYMLIPLLLGLLLTILFVIIILAARQAIIVVFVIIAPLAFVANLLPNTEKWFDKWKDVFMTMLIFFPAFSLVFGGAQLAGQIIIQNSRGNMIMLLFGLAVQVAPLVITPLILKFSGGLLGKIAQITNNPRKGILDRNRNWAKDRAEHARQQNIARGPRLRNPASWGAGIVQAQDFKKRRLKDNTKMWEQAATNRYERSAGYEKIHEQQAEVNLQKDTIHSKHAAHIDHLKATHGTTLNAHAVKAEGAKVSAELANADVSAMTAEYRSGKYNTQGNVDLERIQKTMARNVIETTALKRAAESATIVQQYEYATEMKSGTTFSHGKTLQQIAAGVDPNGGQRALASATTIIQEVRKKTLDNMQTIIMSENPTPKQILELAKGNRTLGIEPSQDAIAAALQLTFGGGDTSQILAGLKDIDLSFNSYPGLTAAERSELQIVTAKALEGNSVKPPFATFGITGKMKQGKNFAGIDFTGAYGDGGLNKLIIDVVQAGKIDSGKLQSSGKDYAEALLSAMQSPDASAVTIERRNELLEQLNITLDPNRDAFEKLGDSKDALKKLRSIL